MTATDLLTGSSQAPATPAPEWSSEPSFVPPEITGQSVTDTVEQADGRLVIAGQFTKVGDLLRYGLARLQADGSPDPTFPNHGGLTPGAVSAVVGLPGGGLLVGGSFSGDALGGRSRVARLTVDGAVDPGFADPQVDGPVTALAPLPDGRVLIGGAFTHVGGQPRQGAAVLLADGSLDASVADPVVAGGDVLDVAVAPDGGLVIAGSFSSVLGSTRRSLARLEPDGALDQGFAPVIAFGGAPTRVEDVDVLTDGRILIGGEFASAGGRLFLRVGRLLADGTGDTTFESPGFDEGVVHSVAAQPDGGVVAVGDFPHLFERDTGVEIRQAGVARLTEDGHYDPTLVDPLVDGSVRWASVLADGDVLVAGTFHEVDHREMDFVARLLPSAALRPGSLDPTFGHNGITGSRRARWEFGTDLALRANGGVVTAGTAYGNGGRFSVVRHTVDGDLDPAFGVSGGVRTNFTPSDDWAHAVAVQSDGRVVAAGHAGGPTGTMAVARYLRDGRLDPSFGNGGKVTLDFGPGAEAAYDVAVQADGKIVLAGVEVRSQARVALARLRVDGSLDPTFDHDGRVVTDVTGADDWAWAVTLGAGGRIIVAGVASVGGGQAPKAVAIRYRRDGRLDPQFGGGDGVSTWRFAAGRSAAATACVVDDQGRVVVAGFDGGGEGGFGVSRLLPDGGIDSSFGVGGSQVVDLGPGEDAPWDVTLDAGQRIVAAGYADDGADVGLVRLLPDGALDVGLWDRGWRTTPGVLAAIAYGVGVQASGRIVVAGGSSSNVVVAGFVPD